MAMAFGSDGSLVVAGNAFAEGLPLVNAYQDTLTDDVDLFVAKFAPDLRTILFSTYLGGIGDELLADIVVDEEGDIFIAASTSCGYGESPAVWPPIYLDPTFPTTAGAFLSSPPASSPETSEAGRGSTSCRNAVLAKLSGDGQNLLYSTFIGGADRDRSSDIALLPGGNAVLVGRTSSRNFPRTGQPQLLNGGDNDGFVVVLSADGSRLEYSSTLGGLEFDTLEAVAITTTGKIVVAGTTASADLPAATGTQPQITDLGGLDVFVASVTPGSPELDWLTYLGGSGNDRVKGIVLNDAGEPTLLGETESSDFPVVSAIQADFGGNRDLTLTRFAADASSIVFSTFIGGSSADFASDIALDDDENILLAAFERRGLNAQPFPEVLRPAHASKDSGMTVLRLNRTASSIDYSFSIGNERSDSGIGAVAVGPAGAHWIAGGGAKNSFPLIDPLFVMPASDGVSDQLHAFITRIDAQPPAFSAQLSLSQSPPRVFAEPGEAIDIEVKLKNIGNQSATNIVISESLGGPLQLLSGVPTEGKFDPATGEWRLSSLAAGVTASLALQITPSEATPNQFPEVLSLLNGSAPFDVSTGDNSAVSRVASAIDPVVVRTGLQAAVLPGGRNVRVGQPATLFGVIANPSFSAVNCTVEPVTPVPASFEFVQVDPLTNSAIAPPNQPGLAFDRGEAVHFALTFTSVEAFPPTELELRFDCADYAQPAPSIAGVNTVVIGASLDESIDLIAVSTLPDERNYIPLNVGGDYGVFAVATANVGARGEVVVSADTGAFDLPFDIRICETNPDTGVCINPLVPTQEPFGTVIEAGQTPSFGVFVRTDLSDAYDSPADSRVFVRFKDPSGDILTSTSVWVRDY